MCFWHQTLVVLGSCVYCFILKFLLRTLFFVKFSCETLLEFYLKHIKHAFSNFNYKFCFDVIKSANGPVLHETKKSYQNYEKQNTFRWSCLSQENIFRKWMKIRPQNCMSGMKNRDFWGKKSYERSSQSKVDDLLKVHYEHMHVQLTSYKENGSVQDLNFVHLLTFKRHY